MSDIYLNFVSAIAIGLIILTMSLVKTGFFKAFVYSLPIPITIALVATNGHINSTNILGLYLITAFLWSVYLLVKLGVNIFIADVIAALGYITLGFLVVKFIKLPLEITALIYAAGWFVFTMFYRSKPEEKVEVVPKINPLLKFSIVTIIAYILFSLKSILAGIVVTFPFSGVFAVVESSNTLHTLAKIWTQNSIAILGMFLAMYYLDNLDLSFRIIVGWLTYLVILMIVRKSSKYLR